MSELELPIEAAIMGSNEHSVRFATVRSSDVTLTRNDDGTVTLRVVGKTVGFIGNTHVFTMEYKLNPFMWVDHKLVQEYWPTRGMGVGKSRLKSSRIRFAIEAELIADEDGSLGMTQVVREKEDGS